ncbi:MAG: hypothetical protein JOZ15_06845 [Acidobacteria bacterium]|nr:hypothetical protein [Acidobacteriota bacterium]
MKKHKVPTLKLSRETVHALTPGALTDAAGGGQSYTCSRNNYSCVASCSDVPCG